MIHTIKRTIPKDGIIINHGSQYYNMEEKIKEYFDLCRINYNSKPYLYLQDKVINYISKPFIFEVKACKYIGTVLEFNNLSVKVDIERDSINDMIIQGYDFSISISSRICIDNNLNKILDKYYVKEVLGFQLKPEFIKYY